MLTRRRLVLGAAALVALAGCASTRENATGGGADPRPGSGGSPGAGVRRSRVETALGTIVLDEPGGVASSGGASAWEPRLVAAARRVGDVWGASRIRGRVGEMRVVVCADDAAFAAAGDGLDADTAGVTTAKGVFLSPAVSTSLTEPGRRAVLAHELTHLWLGQHGTDRSSWWITEGAAEWTAAPLAPLPARSRWPQLTQAAADGRVVDGPPSDIGSELGYEWAHAYVAYLAARAGEDAVRDLVLGRRDASSVRAQARRGREGFDRWLAAQLRGDE